MAKLHLVVALAALAFLGAVATPAGSQTGAAQTPPLTPTTTTPVVAPPTTTTPAVTTPTTTTPAIPDPQTPTPGALYKDGPSGRFLMGGSWLYRADKAEVGLKQGWQSNDDTAGWSPVSVPNAWNVGDDTAEGFQGTVGWYRKDFFLPASAVNLSWIVRFESVNYRSRVWLNGHLLGTHTGAYLPFEFRLPPSSLNRTGVNHLVIRVDNRRLPTDFPPSGLNSKGVPTGGWWNYGGLLREVYLRKVDRVDFSTVRVIPKLPCGTCDATVKLRITVRDYGPGAQRVHVDGTFGTLPVEAGTKIVPAGRFGTFTVTIPVKDPKLWSPDSPNLYDLRLNAHVGKAGKVVQTYFNETGIRSIKVSNGHLYLNGRPLNFRGVGMQEDNKLKGFALDNADRLKIIQNVKALGATFMRSQYPLHPELEELADEYGVMLWSEIPVYSIKTKYLKSKTVRTLAANELRDNILDNGNHPSIVMWSIGNELSSRPGAVQSYYISHAVARAHQLDPTRPVGLAVAAYPSVGCRPQYKPLDVIGFNDYFGWYPGPNGTIADRTLLPDYLDAIHKCYPDKALVISETGAEANRHGPIEEKGTYEFQQNYAQYQFGVFNTKPWLSGALWWALEDFRVRPGWDGGNPRPSPPVLNKGLLDFDGNPKPAFQTVSDIFHKTVQIGPLPGKR